MADPIQALVGLGSNLGDRRGHLRQALAGLAALPDSRIEAVSSVIETDPVGSVSQDRFLNCACLLKTILPPRPLLEAFLSIEDDCGRVRTVDKGPRTVDLDLLFYGDRVLAEAGLIVPHPRLHERAFVLVPLQEIAPAFRHPLLGKTVSELLASLPSSGEGITPGGPPPWTT